MAHGALWLAGPSLDAIVDADLRSVVHGASGFDHGHFHGRMRGPLRALSTDATLEMEGIHLMKTTFSRGAARARGKLEQQAVSLSLIGVNGPTVEGAATLELGGTTTARDARVSLSRGGATLLARAREVRVGSEDVRIDGLVVEGAGQPLHVDVRVAPHAASVRLQSRGADLGRVADVLGFARTKLSGSLAINADVSVNAAVAQGTVTADAAHLSIGDVRDASVHVDASLTGRALALRLRADLGSIGYLRVNAPHVEINGGALDAAAWREAAGAFEVDAGVDLSRFGALLPRNVRALGGHLFLHAKVERDRAGDGVPDVRLTARTAGLVVALRGTDDAQVSDAPLQSSGLDVQLDAIVDGRWGASEVAARIVDRYGLLLAVDAKSNDVPYGALLRTKEPIEDIARKVLFSATAVVPERALARLPSFVPVLGTRGDVAAVLDVAGTLASPTLDLSVRLKNIGSDRDPLPQRSDGEIVAHYSGAVADIRFKVTASGAPLLDGTARIEARMDDLLAEALAGGTRKPTLAWAASAKASLQRFPLDLLPGLAERRVHGRVSGELSLEGLHQDARASASLTFEELDIGTARLTGSSVVATLDDRGLRASGRLGGEGGSADLNIAVGTHWGASLWPTLDATKRIDLRVSTKALRAAVLAPFLPATVAALDGKIDADVRASFDEELATPEMTGRIVLREGLLRVPALGAELHDLKATLVCQHGVIRLTNLSAGGVSGALTGSGEAHISGLALVDARAELRVLEKEPLAISLPGLPAGHFYGDASLTAQARGKSVNVALEIPSLHVRLTKSTAHSAQPLEAPKNVHVGVYGRSGHFIVPPLDGVAANATKGAPAAPRTSTGRVFDVAVHLGDDVDVARGTDDRVAVTGTLHLRIVNDAQLSGQLELRGGRLEVQGRRFEIERGSLTFIGSDPGNPVVAVTAGWTAPDSTRVYADFLGPLKTGKVTLRSEPARPRSEIIALILFGTATGSTTTPYATAQPDGATRAGTAAGGFATPGLSEGLTQLTGMGIVAKVDTTNSANVRPEVELQVARDVSIELALVLGTPPPGTNPDTSYLSVDWRLHRNWSLQLTLGNLGSSIADLLWSYRY